MNSFAAEVTFGPDWNGLFGSSYSGSFNPKANDLELNGASNGVSIKVTNGTSTNGYVKTGDFRAYKGYTIVLTASDNSAITKITSEKGGKTFTNGVKADQGTLVINNTLLILT